MTATPGVRRSRWPVRSGDSSERPSASSSADVWNGLATTSAAPARSASTAPATEPRAVSASAVTAGRQVRAFMITATPSPAGNARSTIATEKWRAPEQRDRLSRARGLDGVVSHRGCDRRDLDGDRRVGTDDEDLPCHVLGTCIGAGNRTLEQGRC